MTKDEVIDRLDNLRLERLNAILPDKPDTEIRADIYVLTVAINVLRRSRLPF